MAPHPLYTRHLVFSAVLFIVAILMGARWYLTVAEILFYIVF